VEKTRATHAKGTWRAVVPGLASPAMPVARLVEAQLWCGLWRVRQQPRRRIAVLWAAFARRIPLQATRRRLLQRIRARRHAGWAARQPQPRLRHPAAQVGSLLPLTREPPRIRDTRQCSITNASGAAELLTSSYAERSRVAFPQIGWQANAAPHACLVSKSCSKSVPSCDAKKSSRQ
jgi:hypothetical protein